MSRKNAFSAAVLFLLCCAAPSRAQLPSGPGWHEIPNTQLLDVCAGENGFPEVLGAFGCRGITEAWSSGIFDTRRNRMIVFGGGHNDYYGNELYAFNLDDQTVERITDPGLPIANGCQEAIAGGTQPNSRHTYDGIEYIESVDKMFVFGGSLACPAGNFGSDTWAFDFASETWERLSPSGPIPNGDAGMMTAYDPVSGLIYLHDRGHLYSYDPVANAYARVTTSSSVISYITAATIHPSERLFIIVGNDPARNGPAVYYFDISGQGSPNLQDISTTGGSPIVGAGYPGLAYDPASDRIAAWAGSAGNSVYFLDVATRRWAQEDSGTNGPNATQNGTHGRWRYSPDDEVFVFVGRVDNNMYIYRAGESEVEKSEPPEALR